VRVASPAGDDREAMHHPEAPTERMRMTAHPVDPSVREDWYDGATLEATEGFVRYNSWMLDLLEGCIRGRALEFGAGTGTMSARVAGRCSELVLVEPAENLHHSLTNRFERDPHVTVAQGTLQEVVRKDPALVAGGFDSVMSFNVLEHIKDDVETLRVAGSLLRADGKLIIMVPALPILYGTVDAQVDHLRRYTRRTLTDAMVDAELVVERVQYFDFLGMIPWLIFGRLLGRTSDGGGVEAYDRWVIPICRAVDRLLGPPVGKSLIAVAARPAR
jgi:SAM-dependent methyltransferase